MRNSANVKAALCLSILCVSCSFAQNANGGVEEAPNERVAIARTIEALNGPASQPSSRSNQQPGLFTPDGRASSEFQRLRAAHPQAFRVIPPPAETSHVAISHEPWGEAEIRAGEPPIVFISPDVALADGSCTYQSAGASQILPLSFILKNVGGDWKIASIRILAPR